MTANYSHAANMAYRVLIALKISELPIDPLEILNKCTNTVTHKYSEVMQRFGKTNRVAFKLDCMEGHDAITIRHDFGNKVGYEVLYDDGANPFRRRFTLAHELGHIILNHSMEEKYEEDEADYFAAELLAPSPVLQMLWEQNIPKQIDTISIVFSLSRSASYLQLGGHHHQYNQERYCAIQNQFLPCVRKLVEERDWLLGELACRNARTVPEMYINGEIPGLHVS